MSKELADRLERHLQLLAHTTIGLPLTAWNPIANDVLEAIKLLRRPSPADGVREAMREALERAAAAFDRYAKGHREKGTAEGDQKAAANDHMAYVCRAALSKDGEGRK